MVEMQIEHWITSGEVHPGEKLPSVRELCDVFNVGRSAVRDAITSLKGKGMLDVKQGEGAFVCRPAFSHLLPELHLNQKKDIQNIFMVRKILEAGIVEIAAELRENHHIEQLKNILEDLKSSNMEAAWKADYQFHLIIAEATQNQFLVQFMQTISTTMQQAIMDCHRLILSCPQITQDVEHQHNSIYEAIRKGDPATAKLAMLEHLTYVEELLSKNS